MDEASSREPVRAGTASILRGTRRDVLVLSGVFDVSSTGVLRAELLEAVAHATGTLTVDVRQVTFLDASTVHVLLEAREAGVESGRGVRLSGATDVVSQVLRICGTGLDLVPGPATDARVGPGDAFLSPAAPNVPAEWRDQGWPGSTSPAPGSSRRDRRPYSRIGALQRRRADDARARAVRRAMVNRFRDRLRRDPLALGDDRFLATADRAVILRAIVVAAVVVGGADACVLRLYDPETQSLHVAQHLGFSARFLDFLATVDVSATAPWAALMATGQPVLIDDITRSPVLAGRPILPVMLAAGTRAVHMYPLHDGARPLGVLSFHYRNARPRHGQPQLVAYSAAMALAHA